MKKKEAIWIFILLVTGSMNIILWLIIHNIVFNLIGIVLISAGLGLYMALRNL